LGGLHARVAYNRKLIDQSSERGPAYILLMESGEVHSVGTVEYPSRTSDPAVQINVGSENLIILTQSGNVYTLGQARFDVVQRNVNGVGSSDTWIWEASLRLACRRMLSVSTCSIVLNELGHGFRVTDLNQ